MKFSIKASDPKGREQTFVIEAHDEKSAVSVLRARGFFPFGASQIENGSRSADGVHLDSDGTISGSRAESELVKILSVARMFLSDAIFMEDRAGRRKLRRASKYIMIGSATAVLVSLIAVLVTKNEGHRYGQAVKSYRAGQVAEALAIVNALSQKYQAKPTASYLKSDCLLQLAHQKIESADHEAALVYLRGVPKAFQKYEIVEQLIENSSQQLARSEEEQRQRTESIRRKPTRLRTYGGIIPYDREKYYSEKYAKMHDEVQGHSSSRPVVRLKDVMTESELDAYSLKQSMDLLKSHTAEQLNRMSDRQLIELMHKNQKR
jgi:hypothetical protein